MPTISQLTGKELMPKEEGKINLVPVEKIVLAEGLITEICLNLHQAEIFWREDGEAVIFTFTSEDGHFINIFDHRKATIQEMGKSVVRAANVFNHVPCLGTMRKGRCLYISLVDINDSKTDIKGRGELALWQGKFDREKFRVPGQALHLPTQICFLEKK